MNRVQFLLCLFGIFISLFINDAQGRSARRLEGEGIQGGDDADEAQFPYQISLQVNGKNICGGSILSKRFIITAAHCVIDEDDSFMEDPMKVVAGIIDLESESDNKVVVDVIEVFVPKEYDPTSEEQSKTRSTGDIAILKLNKDLDIDSNPNLGKVELPKKIETYAGKKAVISGFGYNTVDVVYDYYYGFLTEANGKSYGKMRFAKAEVISNADCKPYFYDLPISKKHICASLVQRDENQPEGVCSGDSGGPLVYNGVQIGVVSSSPLGCREDARPAVYTRVSKYLEFIKKVVNGNTDNSIRKFSLEIQDW